MPSNEVVQVSELHVSQARLFKVMDYSETAMLMQYPRTLALLMLLELMEFLMAGANTC